MDRNRLVGVVLYLPLVVLALTAMVTMSQVGCSGGPDTSYDYYP